MIIGKNLLKNWRARIFFRVGECSFYGERSRVFILFSHVYLGFSCLRHRIVIEID